MAEERLAVNRDNINMPTIINTEANTRPTIDLGVLSPYLGCICTLYKQIKTMFSFEKMHRLMPVLFFFNRFHRKIMIMIMIMIMMMMMMMMIIIMIITVVNLNK